MHLGSALQSCHYLLFGAVKKIRTTTNILHWFRRKQMLLILPCVAKMYLPMVVATKSMSAAQRPKVLPVVSKTMMHEKFFVFSELFYL